MRWRYFHRDERSRWDEYSWSWCEQISCLYTEIPYENGMIKNKSARISLKFYTNVHYRKWLDQYFFIILRWSLPSWGIPKINYLIFFQNLQASKIWNFAPNWPTGTFEIWKCFFFYADNQIQPHFDATYRNVRRIVSIIVIFSTMHRLLWIWTQTLKVVFLETSKLLIAAR